MISYAEFYMRKAIESAFKEDKLEEVPVGCLIVKNEKVLACSGNTTKHINHVVSHAEINVIKKASLVLADWRLDDCDLFVTMEPCLMCMGAIILSRIRSVYYGISNTATGAFHGELPIIDSKLKTFVFSGILEDEIKNEMKTFFVDQRNKR
jgi:tRNA(adenine34) deaminase